MRPVALLLVLIAIGCATGSPPAARPSPADSPATSASSDIDSLIIALGRLPGEFRYIDAERTGSYFTGGEALFRAVGRADTLGVQRLIECFGDLRPSAATVDGRPVQHAKMCFRAFTFTPYYAKRLRSATWMTDLKRIGLLPGRLSATDDELLQARDWWRRYFAAGSPVRL